LDMLDAPPNKLADFAPLFVETVTKWRKELDTICNAYPWDALFSVVQVKLAIIEWIMVTQDLLFASLKLPKEVVLMIAHLIWILDDRTVH